MNDQQIINWETNRWCRERGITSSDLTVHPEIDDVILLIRFREEFWAFMDSRERGIWAAYWGRTYNNKFPLKKNYFNKLTTIIHSAQYRQHIQAQRTITIKAMRARANNKETTSS